MNIQTSSTNEFLADLYLAWVNDFITYEKFAAYYGLPFDAVEDVINAGRKCHEYRVELNKTLNT